MRKNTIVMVGIAVVFGLLAVFVAQGWLNYQAELNRKTVAPTPQQVATRTIVVASAPMRFGTHVAPDSLREVSWPDAAIPAGTYSSIAELTAMATAAGRPARQRTTTYGDVPARPATELELA